MNDRRTDWTAFAAALVSFISVGIIVWIAVAFFGCAARSDVAGYRKDQQTHVQADTRQDAKGGRDVTINDPWTGRIAVLGLAGIPASFLLYLLSKRVPLARKVYDALSGKPCAERQAGRCIPTPTLRDIDPVAGWGALGPQDDQG